MNITPLTYTLTDAGRRLGFCRHTIALMVRTGELASIPTGRKHKRISEAELQRWIKSHEVRGAAALKKAVDARRAA